MTRGVEQLLPALYAEGRLDASSPWAARGRHHHRNRRHAQAARRRAQGHVSTMASGDTSPYVGRLTSPVPLDRRRRGYQQLLADHLQQRHRRHGGDARTSGPKEQDDKPLVAATMFGVTTPAVTKAQEYLESQGYEVLVFHATGTGGRCMESLVRGGFFKGVLDLTTTEWAATRSSAACSPRAPNEMRGRRALRRPHGSSASAPWTMVNFGPWDTVPEQFRDRNLYKHNPTVTLMRTTEQNAAGSPRPSPRRSTSRAGRASACCPWAACR